jgi:glycosyltransferase involved in cell wall biosynthesis
VNNTGHFQEYSFSIAKEAVRRGFDTEIWCPRNYSGPKPPFLKPILPALCALKRDFFSQLSKNLVMARAFARLVSSEKFDHDDIIFYPSVFPADLFSLSLAFTWHRPKARIIGAIRRDLRALLNYVLSYTNSLIGLPALVFFQLCGLYMNRILGIKFASDTEYGTRELGKIGFAGAFTLPIPHLATQNMHGKKREFAICCLGDARFEKGFDLLPDIIPLVLNQSRHVSFIIQSNFQNSPYSAEKVLQSIHALDRLEQKFPRRIKLMRGGLGRKDYLSLMSGCSLVLLPYRRRFYGFGGSSGILAEAVSCGAWIVVPSGTWMAVQKEKYDKIMEFSDEMPESISASIYKCTELDGKIDCRKVAEQIRNWKRYHSPNILLDIVLKNA